MQAVLKIVKKVLPASSLKKIRPIWHGFLAYSAAWFYGRPTNYMVVIGVTGTAGKSTTVQMLAAILNAAGKKTGFNTTVGYFDGVNKHINQAGLSTPGGFVLQKYLAAMKKNDCEYVVLEVSSEGLAQNRHLGINFDVALLTNLSEAHIEAHGGFEKYRAAKEKLFKILIRAKRKIFFPHKVIGLNLADKESAHFASLPADRKFATVFDSGENKNIVDKVYNFNKIYHGEKLAMQAEGSEFELEGRKFEVGLPGTFNAQNALLASACAEFLGVKLETCVEGIAKFKAISGRMQQIPNQLGIKIVVDYAPEPVAMRSALEAMNFMPHSRIIHVFGSTGGHRDIAKRPVFGAISAELADTIIITNDDVYDSDPETIARDVLQGVDSAGHKKATKVFTILDRFAAIKKALEIAKPGDLVLLTGKGSEQFLVLPGNKRISWDEVAVVKQILNEK